MRQWTALDVLIARTSAIAESMRGPIMGTRFAVALGDDGAEQRSDHVHLAMVPLSGRLFGAENGVVRVSGNAVVPMVH